MRAPRTRGDEQILRTRRFYATTKKVALIFWRNYPGFSEDQFQNLENRVPSLKKKKERKERGYCVLENKSCFFEILSSFAFSYVQTIVLFSDPCLVEGKIVVVSNKILKN